MLEHTIKDNQALIGFWDKAFSLSEEQKAEAWKQAAEDWQELAPSEKLFKAACSLGQKKKILDYGCGDGWASIIAAKSGCTDVTAVDAALGAVQAARFYTEVYGVDEHVHAVCGSADWLESIASDTFDGLICSNVLDVIPSETAETILRELARIVTQDACVIIGLNYYLSPEAVAARGMELADGNRLYIDETLRLVSRTDEEWTQIFSTWYTVERLEHFAWPGEGKETRRLFWLRKTAGVCWHETGSEGWLNELTEHMIRWAKDKLGNSDYTGWCLSFIEDALEKSSGIEIFGGDSAKASALLYADGMRQDKPERGAFVFYDCICLSPDGPVNWGHCGISLGDGQVIHAWDRVRIDDYRQIEKMTALSGDHPKYIGWVPVERVLKQKEDAYNQPALI